jgi:hypothetical protein
MANGRGREKGAGPTIGGPSDPEGRVWHSIIDAAQILGLTPGALRKSLERAATRSTEGVVEASVHGVRGRKWGSHWRVRLGDWA